jgi:serine/threonine-protein kinase HipA
MGLPAWFENLLPERDSALRDWLCRHFGLRDGDSAALLQAVGRDLPGAVEISGNIERTQSTASEPVAEGEMRFSLAGVQLKLSMVFDGKGYALPGRDQTGSWIVKVPGERFPDIVRVEAATMAWARAAGLVVPTFRIVEINSLRGIDPKLLGTPMEAFAIERFDRHADGRVHQEDFAQALEMPPSDKYSDRGNRRIGYDGLCRLVGDACGVSAREDFVRRLAFVVASGNGDAHLKNWSFQWGHEHRPWLSPCYDQVATISWGDIVDQLALSLGRVRRFDDINRECLRRFGEKSGFADAEDCFFSGLQQARAGWLAVADDAPTRMREALVAHWERVPVLNIVGVLPRN